MTEKKIITKISEIRYAIQIQKTTNAALIKVLTETSMGCAIIF